MPQITTATQIDDLCKYIKLYFAAGLKAFPVYVAYKPDGKKDTRWSHLWQQNPPSLNSAITAARSGKWNCLAIITGEESDLFVLDVDMHATPSGFDTLADNGIIIPDDIPYVDTPTGGRHYYFRFPLAMSGLRTSRAFTDLQIDFRGTGGLVFAPPSFLPPLPDELSGEGQYCWGNGIDGVTLPDLPDDLLAFIIKICAPKERPAPAPHSAPAKPFDSSNDAENLTAACQFLAGALGYDDWVRAGMALANVPDGLYYWQILSSSTKHNDSPDEIDRKFKSFNPNEIKIATLFDLAISHGFQYPDHHQRPTRRNSYDEPPTGDVDLDELDAFIEAHVYGGDAGIVHLVTKLCKHRILFDHTNSRWLQYNDGIWEYDRDKSAIRYAIEQVRLAYENAAEKCAIAISISSDKSDIKYYNTANKACQSLCKKMRNHSTLTRIIHAKTAMATYEDKELSTCFEAFDADPDLFNCQNGYINVETGKHYPHSYETRFMKQSLADYKPDAKCPNIMKFLETILVDDKGKHSPELMTFMQEFAGLCLSGSHRTERFLYAYGSGGNGKTTFFELMKLLLNDYMADIPIETLMLGGNNNDNASNLACIKGARLIVSSEIPQGKLNTDTVKMITGGGTMSARQKYGIKFEFRPEGMLVFVGNRKIKIDDDSTGMWRRMMLLEFLHVFPADEKDMDTVLAELQPEIDGFLLWALAGYQRVRKQGFHPPEVIVASTAEYQHQSDLFGTFLDECCIVDDGRTTKAKALHDRFKAFCKDNAIRIPEKFNTKTKMLDELERRNFDIGPGDHNVLEVLDIEIIENTDQNDDKTYHY